MRGVALFVILLVVLAGCGGNPTSAENHSPTPESTFSKSITSTQTHTASSTSTVAQEHQNPWRKETVSVRVKFDDVVDEPGRHRHYLRDAISFWNENGETYSSHSVDFEITNSTNADVELNVVPEITVCGDETTTSTFGYCVNSYSEGETAETTTSARIVSRYNDSITQVYYRGMFGQLLGVDNTESVPGVSYPDEFQYRDPWPESNPVIVNISNEVNTTRNFSPLVRSSISYWHDGEGKKYANYTVNWSIRPDAKSADLTVQFVDSIPPDTCDVENDTDVLGCADLLTPVHLGDNALVRVEGGYTDNSTLQILKHEFGHIHGRNHGQEPRPLMNENVTPVDTLPRPNATDRPLPWKSNDLSVSLTVQSEQTHDQHKLTNQVNHSLSYFAQGADGHIPNNVSFYWTENQSKVNISIVIADELPNSDAKTSTMSIYGRSVDSDPALEYYTNMTIYIHSEVPSDHVGWHVGYWMADGLDADPVEDYPPPFDDPELDERENWWM